MCSECARLTRQVRELQEELDEYRAIQAPEQTPRATQLQLALRLRPQAAKMLETLMDRKGHVVSRETLVERCGIGGKLHDDWMPSRGGPFQNVRVNMSRVRKALLDRGITGGIANVHGEGYRLTRDAADKVENAL